jgi:uncharacterized protein with HEPN domain
MRRDNERLADILESIEKIQKYFNKEEFGENEVLQAAMLHFLQIIGESCRFLSPEFKANHENIKWAEIIAFRNILVHQYFHIDEEIIGEIIENDIPLLKSQILDIID